MTNLLKIKGADGNASETEDANQSESEHQTNAADCEAGSSGAKAAGGPGVNKQDMQQKMSSGLDKLDLLLDKTENAQYSMAHQTKQMKSFLK